VVRNESIRSTERLAMLPFCSACHSHCDVLMRMITTGFVRDRLNLISITEGTVYIITACSVILTCTA
jgi:hypothetical protein